MSKIKYALSVVGSAAVLMFGLALPASAQPTETGPGDNTQTTTVSLGNCAGIINNTVVQVAATTAVNEQSNQANGGGGQTNNSERTQSNSGSANASTTQTGGVNFAPNCGTTNNHVTHVTQQHVTKHVAAASSSQTVKKQRQARGGHASANMHRGANMHHVQQVAVAPTGGVNAGAGGAAGSITASIAGLGGSLAAFGYGLLRLRKFDV